MSALDRLKDAATNRAVVASIPDPMDGGFHGARLVGFLTDKLERAVYAGAFGVAKGFLREKSLVGGVPLDILAGTAMTLAAAGLNLATEGKSAIAKHAERIGDAGVMSFCNSLGASYGAQWANYQVAVVPSAAKLPPGSAPMVLGALPQAAGGAYLTAEELAKYSVPK